MRVRVHAYACESCIYVCMYIRNMQIRTVQMKYTKAHRPIDRMHTACTHTHGCDRMHTMSSNTYISHTGKWLQSKSSPQKARTPRKRWHPGTLGIVRIDRISLHQPFPEYRHSLFRTTTTYISTLSLSLCRSLSCVQ